MYFESRKEFDRAITVGVFDVLHKGHVNIFKEMAKRSDHIIVIIHDDMSTFENKGHVPVQSVGHRHENIVSFLDSMERQGEIKFWYVGRTYAPDPTMNLASFVQGEDTKGKKIVYVRGDDWKEFPGWHYLVDHDVPIHFVEYTDGISTTQIRKEHGV